MELPKPGQVTEPHPWHKDLVYLRVSSDPQLKGSGPEVQLKECLARMTEKGIEGEPLILLESKSATEDMGYRPVLAFVRQLLRKKRVERVWCQSTSRMSRQAIDHVVLDHEAQEAGGQYLYAWQDMLDNIPPGPIRDIILHVLGLVDQLESSASRTRMYNGRLAKWTKKRLMGCSRPMYGHIYTDTDKGSQEKNGRMIANPETAPVVLRMYQWLLDPSDPHSLRAIAARLDREGITPPKGNHWSPQKVADILEWEGNIGIALVNKTGSQRVAVTEKDGTKRSQWKVIHKPKDEWIDLGPGVIEPIPSLTLQIYDAALRILAQNKELRAHRGLKNEGEFILAHRARCGTCGDRMRQLNGKRSALKDGSHALRRLYVCGDAHSISTERCPRPCWISATKLEDAVWDVLTRFINDDYALDKLIANRHIAPSPVVDEIAHLERLIKSTEEEQLSIYNTKVKDGTFLAKKRQADLDMYEQRLELLGEQLERLRGRQAAQDIVANQVMDLKKRIGFIRAAVARGSDEDKCMIMRGFDIQVRVWPHREEASMSEKQKTMPNFTVTSILGPLFTGVSLPSNGINRAGRNTSLIIYWENGGEPILLGA